MKRILTITLLLLGLTTVKAGWGDDLNSQLNSKLGTNSLPGLTNGFVTSSITNAFATTNYVNTATNNFGNSVSVSLTNAANQFAGSGGGLTNLNYNNITNQPAIPSTNGFVTASITNGLATTNYVNAITNGLATTDYVNTATNNFGGTVAVNMTNAANKFTGVFTNGTYYGNGSGLTNLSATNLVGTLTNNTTGNATTASGGWPTQWPISSVTNANWATNSAAGIAAAGGITNPPSGSAGQILTAISSTTYAWSNAPSGGGSGTLTNNYTFTTSSNPTNQYAIGVLYTNLTGYRALLVGAIHIGSNGDTNTLNYTNGGTGYSLPFVYIINSANITVPFFVPLNTNATFKFNSVYSVSYLTNTVLWAAP